MPTDLVLRYAASELKIQFSSFPVQPGNISLDVRYTRYEQQSGKLKEDSNVQM